MVAPPAGVNKVLITFPLAANIAYPIVPPTTPAPMVIAIASFPSNPSHSARYCPAIAPIAEPIAAPANAAPTFVTPCPAIEDEDPTKNP